MYLILGNLTIVKEMNHVACYRLQNTRHTSSYSCLNQQTNRQAVELYGLLVTFELAAVTLTRGLVRQKGVKEEAFCRTWKVSPSPSRLAAKSGVLAAVAANILCTLLPSGSLPSATI